MRLVSDAGVTTISHDGETHTPVDGTDDVFELPGELARHLLEFPALGWREAAADELPDTVDDELELEGDDEAGETAEAPAPRTPRKRAPRKTAAPAA